MLTDKSYFYIELMMYRNVTVIENISRFITNKFGTISI